MIDYEEEQTLEHGAHHHEQLVKQDPSNPRSLLHKPNQVFSPPSRKQHWKVEKEKKKTINTCHNKQTLFIKKINIKIITKEPTHK